MNIKCKLIELIEDEISSGIKIFVASISIIQNQGILKGSFNSLELFTLILPRKSGIAKEMISNPNNIINFNLNNYTLKKVKFEGIQNKFAYFHNSLLETLDSSKSQLQKTENNIDYSINECLFSTHLEMFFYFVYIMVIDREFQNSSYNDNYNTFSKRYEDVMSLIIIKKFKLRYDNYLELSEEDILKIEKIYDDAISYPDDFELSISYFINNNSNALNISQNIFNDEKYLYSTYIQKTVIKAFDLINKRIHSNRYSTEIFGHKFTFSDKRIELIIFPTPYSFTIKDRISEIFKNKKLSEILIAYLEKNNISILEDKNIKEKFNTKWTFKVQGILNVFYLDRLNKLSFCEFGKQNRDKLFDTLFNKGQINFSISKNTEGIYY